VHCAVVLPGISVTTQPSKYNTYIIKPRILVMIIAAVNVIVIVAVIIIIIATFN